MQENHKATAMILEKKCLRAQGRKRGGEKVGYFRTGEKARDN